MDLPPLAELAIDAIGREYPSLIVHLAHDDGDVRPPRELTPAFCGSFDWHSAVHGCWTLARVARRSFGSAIASRAIEALAATLVPEKIAGEVSYLAARPTFERPYGLAWLLRLAAELHAWGEPARSLSAALEPLVQVAIGHLADWLPRLGHPVRSGVHSQTAFAMGLALDWARAVGDAARARLIEQRALAFHGEDRGYPLHLEPSGEDFLSPSLGAADLMRRVLDGRAFAAWLDRSLPDLPRDGSADWLVPAVPFDRDDDRLGHLAGLALSRAFMMEAIAGALPSADARSGALRSAADVHRRLGLAALPPAGYGSAHWLGTFAVYLLTRGWLVP